MVEEAKKEGQEGSQEKLLTQAQVDAIVQERLAREKAKFADYPDLKKKVEEYEKSQDEKQLKILEEQKKYEEALKIHNTKLNELQGLVSKKDSEIADMRVSGSLISEINKQNAYAEETMALLKSQAVFDKDGNIRIKGRDANGLEVLHSVEEGVKKFLEQRPHLVRVTGRNGAGTPPAGQGGGSAVIEGGDLTTLSQEVLKAQSRGEFKKVKELQGKIRAQLTSQRASG